MDNTDSKSVKPAPICGIFDNILNVGAIFSFVAPLSISFLIAAPLFIAVVAPPAAWLNCFNAFTKGPSFSSSAVGFALK